jgi:hypothetical protein
VTLLLVVLAGSLGCEPPVDGGSPEGAPAAPSGGPASAAVTAPGTNWRAWADAESRRLEREDPAVFLALAEMAPVTTRGGKLRFVDPVLHRPAAAPVLLVRLARGAAPAAVRRALAEALPLTGGPIAGALDDLLAAEAEASVRVELAAALEQADVAASGPAVRRALLDTDDAVRAAALFAVASRSDGASYTDAIVTALSSPGPETRAASIHAAGVLRLAAAKPALRAMIEAPGASRGSALLALSRVDPEEARGRPDLDALAADPALTRVVARVRAVEP